MSTSLLDHVARRSGGPTPRRVLLSELLKLRGLRSPVVLLAVAAASVLVLGPVNALGQVVAPEDGEPLHGVGDALALVLMGTSNAALVLGVLGVLTVTHEYTSGSIGLTFTAVPRRPMVVLGKAAALAAATVPVLLVSLLVAFEAGRRILHEGGFSLTWTGPDVARVLVGSIWYAVGWAVLGQTLAWLLRSAVGAAFALLGVMFVLPALATLVPGGAGDTIRMLMVSEAGAAMLATDPAGPVLSPLAGALVWTVYLVAGLGAAVLVTGRRDVEAAR